MDMRSGSMPRIALEITGGSPRDLARPTFLAALRSPREALPAWVRAVRQRRAARRAWQAEEQRLEWWRAH
jgi:hypothetical protein